MPDVLQKIITANDINNGSAILSADKLGGYTSVDPAINKHEVIIQSGVLDTRFDDIRYYTSSG